MNDMTRLTKRARSWSCAVAIASAGVALPALAVKVGEPLFVKAKNTRLMSKPSAAADAIAILQPGERVTWRGAEPGAPQWHRVDSGEKKGLVFQSNLSPTAPNLELTAGDRTRAVDAKAFASSGAAIKALSDGAVKYGESGPLKGAVAELQSLEKLAKDVTDAQVAAHAKQAGLFPVVGPKGGAR